MFSDLSLELPLSHLLLLNQEQKSLSRQLERDVSMAVDYP